MTAAQPAREQGAAAGRGTLAQRLRAWLLVLVSWIACRLPERPLIALADLGGAVWYRAAPERRAIARANLRRVVDHLAATGTGPASASAAAGDPRALERLVRAAFRHSARYYLEVVRAPALTPRFVRERLLIETPEVVDEAFRGDRPVIFVGLHFGAIELPGLYVSMRSGRAPSAPMEAVDDPELQRWFVRTRGAIGVRIVGLREARRVLLAALAQGDSVGLIADRDIGGGGVEVPLFGAPAPLPAGPALLAIESGAPLYVAAVRREGRGRYRGRVRRVEVPNAGTRRERVVETLQRTARAFEAEIAVAPEQWWAVFFPIWPDLPAAAALARSPR